jgi:hypothetical protein
MMNATYRPLFVLTALAAVSAGPSALAVAPAPIETAEARRWADVALRGLAPPEREEGHLRVVANHDPVQRNSRNSTPLRIGKVEYTRRLFCHANSEIIVRLPSPGRTFDALAGIESRAGGGTVVFSVKVGGREVFRSGVVRLMEPAVPVKVDLQGAREFTIAIGDAGDGISFDQSVWAEARVTLADGRQLWLGDMPFERGLRAAGPPFSFRCGDRAFADVLGSWKVDRKTRARRLPDRAHCALQRPEDWPVLSRTAWPMRQ